MQPLLQWKSKRQIYTKLSHKITSDVASRTKCFLQSCVHSSLEITLKEKKLRYSNLIVNPLKPELNPICYLLALLGAHHFLQVSRVRVKSLTFRRLMSYIYGAPILDVSRSHNDAAQSVGLLWTSDQLVAETST